jgi:hypothetical protein
LPSENPARSQVARRAQPLHVCVSQRSQDAKRLEIAKGPFVSSHLILGRKSAIVEDLNKSRVGRISTEVDDRSPQKLTISTNVDDFSTSTQKHVEMSKRVYNLHESVQSQQKLIISTNMYNLNIHQKVRKPKSEFALPVTCVL